MRPVPFQHAAACCGVFLLSLAAPAAQQPPARPAERGTEFLNITFAAVTADGTPAVDLTAADVAIRIDGRPREVKSLQWHFN